MGCATPYTRLWTALFCCSGSRETRCVTLLQRKPHGLPPVCRKLQEKCSMDHLWTPWRYAYVTQEDTRDARAGVPAQLTAWPGDHHCVFCNLIAAADYAIEHGMAPEEADRAANIVLRGQSCYICLNAYPYSSGHVMIVPYVHGGDLGALAPEAAQEMMELAQRAARAQGRAYSPDGINIGLNLG